MRAELRPLEQRLEREAMAEGVVYAELLYEMELRFRPALEARTIPPLLTRHHPTRLGHAGDRGLPRVYVGLTLGDALYACGPYMEGGARRKSGC